MKKILFLAVAVAAMASCNKIETVNVSEQNELSFFTMANNATKAYVTETSFNQIVNPADKAAGEPTDRDMVISAYNVTDSDVYFQGKTFMKNSDDLWHNYVNGTKTPIYWPIGKTLKFLAYSQSNSADDALDACPKLNPIWADDVLSVKFEITSKSNQDDILFAGVSGNDKSSTATRPLAIQFDHAQSWITFVLRTSIDSEAENVLTINSIVWDDVYDSGELTLSYNEDAVGVNKSKAEWNFFTQNSHNVAMADPYGQLDTPLGGPSTYRVLNMLVPPQAHNGFVVNYTINGIAGQLKVEKDDVKLVTKAWEMGKHYTYNLTFTVNIIGLRAARRAVWSPVALSPAAVGPTYYIG